MLNLILIIVFSLVALGILGFGIYRAISAVKNPVPATNNYPLLTKKLGLLAVATGLSTFLIFLFFILKNNYKLSGGEWIQLVLGAILFGGCLSTFIYSFIVHYYGKEIPEKLNKYLYYSLICSVVISIGGLILLTNGFAEYISYPLSNGISFDKGFVNPTEAENPTIAWYALCILSGAILVYFICDHRMYVEYGKHGILESTFLIAFPAGIVGARIGYVIGEWNHGPNSFADRVANGQWWAPLAIWEGGLTIISGALIGIIVGVLWYIWKNRKYSIWTAVDIIVPTILIAQAVGRWGNFFNAEVHGYQVLESNWRWLPTIIRNNMHYSESAGWSDPGMIYMPLFLIESISNLVGYFVISRLVGKLLRKYREGGDLAFLYLSWYGLTRVIMEPLRDKAYNMGNDGYWSWFWSFVFVLIGATCIGVNHIVRYIIARKKNTYILQKNSLRIGVISSAVTLVISVIFIAFGAVMMMKNTQTPTISFNEYNRGLILLMLGLSFFVLLGVTVPYIIAPFRKENA